MTTNSWRDRAACKGMAGTHGYQLFYDENYVSQAKKVCADCPVRAECLNDAIANKVWDGVYGGMTPRERNSHQRRWRRETFGGTRTPEAFREWTIQRVS